jgi:hypothetical protein
MLGLVVIVLALLAVIAMANWLRSGGGYDKETGPLIGTEAPGWKPHEVEPWQAENAFYREQDPGE